MHLAFSEDIIPGDIILNQEESLHISKVLRLTPGEKIQVTDGKGSLATGTISNSSKKNLRVEVSDIETTECPYSLELAISPPKSNDRLELILEKCTELGISKIHPVICYHSERRKLNNNRLQKILLSAMKQSQKSWVPVLAETQKFSDFIKTELELDKFILHCNAEISRSSLKSELSSKKSLLMIGPEGDFSKQEVESAVSAGFNSAHLGTERLRTETAAIFSASIYHTIFTL